MSKNLQYLVIHCTDTPAGRKVSADDIKRWHTSPAPIGNGWSQVGYTDMIHLDGEVERLVDNNEDNTVDPWEITNGAKGINSVSRHIVYVGGKGGDTRTDAQKKALEDYVKDFHKRFPPVKIIGHNEVAAKACPSFDVQKWLKSIGL
ncbi:N-acetylmuramoyl-L-alanine amidase [Dysgonomonas sp. ZJ709]|uniref:N-acetylmuramoyl-L-alanine amidase n=1 Tax=Dysgonomonas sp. ZJ709 TaxID=2709797 RepID=UPI0013EBB829|nr:N-acetylmuramoyl-L-alanine amidase [Dysgonomonas sp. ZJ709]